MENLRENGRLAIQLYENALPTNKNEYMGKIMLRGVINIERLAQDLIKNGLELPPEQIKRLFPLLTELVFTYVADGFSVNLDIGILRAGINGTFANDAAKFNADTNHVTIGFYPSRRARQIIKTATVEVAGLANTGCSISHVIDMGTGEENSTITVGHVLKIFGNRLSVEGDEADIGVRFINADDEAKSVMVSPKNIIYNTLSQVSVLVPPLESGDWYVQITTQSTKSKKVLLKKARTYRLDFPLSVL